MRFLFTFLFLSLLSKSWSQELTADANTLLLLHFNNSVNGAAGETPISSSNISYATGKLGNALSVGPNTTLRFDTTQNLNPKQGTLEFWIKPTSEGTVLDMGIGGGLSVQIGFYTRMIFNIYGINGNPENGVFGDGTIWKPNIWSHIAFTWQDRELKLYFNGSLAFQNTINFDLPNINLSYFNIGSSINGSNQLQGLLDELRISNRARTALEICQSYFSGQISTAITNLAVRDPSAITLYKTWKLYLQKVGFWKAPSVYTLNGTDTVNIANTCINWSISNTTVAELVNGIIAAKNAGSTSLIGAFEGQSVTIPINVIEPVKALEYETNIDPFLVTPASCHSITVPVVVIIYIPTLDGVNINTAETDIVPIPQQTITELKKQVLRINSHTKFSLEEGSKFRGYNNPNANPYLGYKIIDYIYVYEPVPRGFPDPGAKGVFYHDYNQIIERFNGQNYVDNLGVKEFWIFGYAYKDVNGVESNMSSPTTGDISNSYRHPDDLPIYSKTYIVYNYNITRGGNEATHNHGHQIESMCDYVANKQDGNSNMFWQNFVGRMGNNPPLGRCGDTHHPANSNVDYDYHNSTLVASDIKDWKPAGGTTTMVNKDTWGNVPYSWPSLLYPSMIPNEESNWYTFWMQSIPGNGNQIPYGSKWMTNWWRFLGDWDSTTVKIGLYQNTPETNAVCSSSISTSLGSSSVCAGTSFSINYLANGLSLNAGNIFTAQLSNAAGSFSNPVNIGTLSSVSASGEVSVTIPQSTVAGTNYLIRIISSNQAFTGSVSSLLTIKALPSTPTITAGSATAFCTGGNVVLTSNAGSGNQWYKDGVAISGSTGTTLNVTTNGSYTTKVTLNGCESSTSNAISVSVNSVPPTPTITAGSAITFCSGGSVMLTSNAASGNQWYKDGVAINGSTAITLNVTSGGNYTVKTAMNGCESAISNIISVTVNPTPPTPVIGQNGNQLVSLSPTGNQWYLDNVAITGATGQNYTPTASGNYTSQVTINGCSSAFSNTFNFIITAIQNTDVFNNQIKVLPNPVRDKLTIINSSNALFLLHIRLVDIYGRQLINLKSSGSRIEINLAKYSSGLYIIWIEDKKNKIVGKKAIVKTTE